MRQMDTFQNHLVEIGGERPCDAMIFIIIFIRGLRLSFQFTLDLNE